MSLDFVLLVLSVLGGVGLFCFFGYYLIGTLRAPRFADQHPPEPAAWPKVSIVIPACNEERSIESAMRTLLALDYPDLEIVIVDDRSTDGTGAVLDRIAAEDRRLTVVHNRELPAGWLGKVHAMHRGLTASTGAFVVFTDADVHIAPGFVKKAIALAEQVELDHLTLLPPFETRGVLIGAMLSSFFFGYVARVRSSNVALAKNAPPFGFGGFNMVRRAAFDKTPGCEWFKMEILDDVALGEMMQKHGRSGFAIAGRELGLEYYASMRAALLGWEKNFPAALGQYQPARIFGTTVMFVLLAVSPILPWLRESGPDIRWLSFVAIAPLVVLPFAAKIRFDQSFFHASLQPLSLILMGLVLARSGVLWLARGGIVWRGTFYPTKLLREGMRVTFRM